MLKFSWAYRGQNELGVDNFYRESNLTEQRYMDRFNRTRTIMQEVLSTADSAIFVPDASSSYLEKSNYRSTIRRGFAWAGTFGFKETTSMECTGKEFDCRKLDLPAQLCPQVRNLVGRISKTTYHILFSFCFLHLFNSASNLEFIWNTLAFFHFVNEYSVST